MTETIKGYAEAHRDEMLTLLRELCAIPAPSHHEEKRAEFCRAWLERAGARGVYIDEAKNVVFPYHCEGSDQILAVFAHTDTVFPDREPMPFVEKDGILSCPGIGDDTANLVILMMTVRYLLEQDIRPEQGILFVCNSCEEGLGNLKGCRQIFRDYAGRIAHFVTFDGYFEDLSDRCLGSHRYEVEVKTPGGHSYSAFGTPNAIDRLSAMVGRIYSIEVPKIGDSVTTYNVGLIRGGTSVNTIAQSATMLCEYRSDNRECLAIMEEHFREIFEGAKEENVEVLVTPVGDRPCMGDVDRGEIARMVAVTREITHRVTGILPQCQAMSTDGNIPLSLGVPALCMGLCEGGGAHTREEWIKEDSFHLGLEAGIQVVLALS